MRTKTTFVVPWAFSQAELQSERLRILAVLTFFAVFMLVAAVRMFGVRTATLVDPRLWHSLSLVFVIVVFELWMLRCVNRGLAAGTRVAGGFWVTTTVLETTMPALAIAFLPNEQIEAAYQPLASPALLVFFLFIIMSVLRLSPAISIVAGVSASFSYICAALYLGWRPASVGEVASFAQSGVTLNAVTLLMAGVVSAAVSRQIRKHLDAALGEAAKKRQLDAIQHDLLVARSIQQSLLPQAEPQLPGFAIAGFNQPADDTGGDYFDWQSLQDGSVVVSLADVTGHGIGPALLASVCRAYARSAFRGASDLRCAFEHINETFGADLMTGRFATFVAVICCPKCPEIQLLSAGHGPLFVYSRSADCFMNIESHTLPFGILSAFDCDPPSCLRLQSGDVLLLASDGLFEWENGQGEEFGTEQVQKAIRQFRDCPPGEIATKVYASAREFSNGTIQQDDLTAVVIKRL